MDCKASEQVISGPLGGFFILKATCCSNNGHGIRVVPAKELVASIAKDEECIVSGNPVFLKFEIFYSDFLFRCKNIRKIHY